MKKQNAHCDASCLGLTARAFALVTAVATLKRNKTNTGPGPQRVLIKTSAPWMHHRVYHFCHSGCTLHPWGCCRSQRLMVDAQQMNPVTIQWSTLTVHFSVSVCWSFFIILVLYCLIVDCNCGALGDCQSHLTALFAVWGNIVRQWVSLFFFFLFSFSTV